MSEVAAIDPEHLRSISRCSAVCHGVVDELKSSRMPKVCKLVGPGLEKPANERVETMFVAMKYAASGSLLVTFDGPDIYASVAALTS